MLKSCILKSPLNDLGGPCITGLIVSPETPSVCCSPDITPSTYSFVADGVALPLTNVGVVDGVGDGDAMLMAVEKKGVEEMEEVEEVEEVEEGCRMVRLRNGPERLAIRLIIIRTCICQITETDRQTADKTADKTGKQ